ncbi:hypothetical protein NicSoilB4_15340 [Arthrobacter sp. NicSoilB4]|nr:hypothetical protein NicSoilB4_15340 [Arthrobacter sp. NicSoilB4]
MGDTEHDRPQADDERQREGGDVRPDEGDETASAEMINAVSDLLNNCCAGGSDMAAPPFLK